MKFAVFFENDFYNHSIVLMIEKEVEIVKFYTRRQIVYLRY